MNSTTSSSLYGVWGSSYSDVHASGGYPDGRILQFNGSAWRSVWKESYNSLWRLWGRSRTEVYAAGFPVLRFDGKAWSKMTQQPVNMTYHGIWGTKGGTIYLAGRGGTRSRYDGNRWHAIPTVTSKDYYGVWGSSASDVFVVGEDGAIEHYDGKKWASMKSGVTQTIYDVWGVSRTEVYAVGFFRELLRYDGKAWKKIPIGGSSAYHYVVKKEGNDLLIGTWGGIVRYDGKTWNMEASSLMSSQDVIEDIWVGSPCRTVAVGRKGLILHHVPL